MEDCDSTENIHDAPREESPIIRHVQTEDLGCAHMSDVMKFINNIFAPAVYSVAMFLMDIRFNFLIWMHWAREKYGDTLGKIVMFIKNNIIVIAIIAVIIMIPIMIN